MKLELIFFLLNLGMSENNLTSQVVEGQFIYLCFILNTNIGQEIAKGPRGECFKRGEIE